MTARGTALVIVASTRAAKGIYEDKSGPIAVNWLREQGFETPDAVVVTDNDFPGRRRKSAHYHLDLGWYRVKLR